MAVSNFSPLRYVFSMVVPRIKFLNLIVVLAAPRACFIILNDNTLYGSPSNSTVNPFLISDVSMATCNVVFDVRDRTNDGVGMTKADVQLVIAQRAKIVVIIERNIMVYAKNKVVVFQGLYSWKMRIGCNVALCVSIEKFLHILLSLGRYHLIITQNYR